MDTLQIGPQMQIATNLILTAEREGMVKCIDMEQDVSWEEQGLKQIDDMWCPDREGLEVFDRWEMMEGVWGSKIRRG